MFVFVDETGNTGANLFDSAQPEFLTGALVTKTDFDVRRSRAVRSLCKRHGISSIHGSVIGVEAVENVAGPLLRILKEVDARFFISRVEKSYLLATKLFDTFFDSGENAAAPWTAYNLKPLRLLLCFKVACLIDEELARNFWTMLMTKSEDAARKMIPGICEVFYSASAVCPTQDHKSWFPRCSHGLRLTPKHWVSPWREGKPNKVICQI
ncbi:MAG: hypothetical protein OXI17_03985 [Gammaproteobacteria bacterium]|nr:hypothetical protein [Gammaproteobacteria bacterium]